MVVRLIHNQSIQRSTRATSHSLHVQALSAWISINLPWLRLFQHAVHCGLCLSELMLLFTVSYATHLANPPVVFCSPSLPHLFGKQSSIPRQIPLVILALSLLSKLLMFRYFPLSYFLVHQKVTASLLLIYDQKRKK